MNDERAQPPDEESEAPPTPPTAPAPSAASSEGAATASEGATAGETASDTPLAEPEAGPPPAEAAGPGEAGPDAPAEAAEPDGPDGPGRASEQIEWRPVVTGETIEWQPVVSAAEDEPARPDAPVDEPEFDEQAWEQALAADPLPDPVADERAGNGAAPVAPAGIAAHPASGVRRPAPPAPPPGTGPGPDEPSAGGEGIPNKAKRQIVILSALTAFIVLVAVAGFVLSRGAAKKGSSVAGSNATATTVRPATGGTTVPPTELITFKDDQIGFAIRYPKTWSKYVPPVSDIRLVLQANQNDGVSIRILPIQTVATQENIGNFKAVTDAIVFGDQHNKLIQEQLVLLNGKLTYYYLYTFQDPNGQQGLHAHYFVFEGLRMLSMVFQSLPADDFTNQAAVFDQVAESLTVEPAPAGATAVPAPTTTVS